MHIIENGRGLDEAILKGYILCIGMTRGPGEKDWSDVQTEASMKHPES
jgi:hypothetical protein